MVDTLHPPLEVVASWPKPNYVNPQTHGPGLMIVASVLPAIAILVVGVRLYARFKITKAPGIDDILIVGALVFGIALSCLVMIGNQIYYSGYHIWDIPLASAVPHRINVWLGQVAYTLALSCVKISVLLFYRRLSVSFTRCFLIAVWVGIVYNILYCIGFILTLCLLCRPLDAYWKSFNPEYYFTAKYKCGSEQLAEPLSAIFSVIGDFYSTVLPLTLVSRLTLPRRQKWALYFLFSLGFTVVATGSIRSYYLYRVVNVDYDFTWTLWKIWMLGEFELWLAVYAASAPALKPFFKRYMKKMSSRGGSSGRENKQVYIVKSDGRGGIGKVQRVFVSKKRSPETYLELSSEQRPEQNATTNAEGQICKTISFNIEPYDAEALGADRAGPSRNPFDDPAVHNQESMRQITALSPRDVEASGAVHAGPSWEASKAPFEGSATHDQEVMRQITALPPHDVEDLGDVGAGPSRNPFDGPASWNKLNMSPVVELPPFDVEAVGANRADPWRHTFAGPVARDRESTRYMTYFPPFPVEDFGADRAGPSTEPLEGTATGDRESMRQVTALPPSDTENVGAGLSRDPSRILFTFEDTATFDRESMRQITALPPLDVEAVDAGPWREPSRNPFEGPAKRETETIRQLEELLRRPQREPSVLRKPRPAPRTSR